MLARIHTLAACVVCAIAIVVKHQAQAFHPPSQAWLACAESSSTIMHGGVQGLYPSEPPDPNRRTLKIAFLAPSRPKQPTHKKTDKEAALEKYIWGRWKLQEESIERPSTADLKAHGAKLQPTYIKYTEDLLFDMHGSLMLTSEQTIGYGCGWTMRMGDVYVAPTLRFRIDRKGIGIYYDEFDDLNDLPSMSFYSGSFLDEKMDCIKGIVQRNRDIARPKGQPRIVVNVGKFTMSRLAEPEQKQSDIVFKETLRAPRVVNADSLSRFRRDPSPPFHGKHDAR